MGSIKVKDYLINLTKYDDIDRNYDTNQIILDKYIERIHADKLHCHKPYYPGTKEPKRPYKNYILKSPYSTYLVREREISNSPEIKHNVNNPTKVNTEAIFGKVYNDCGINSVEASVGYQNTYWGKLYYSITQDLKTLKGYNKQKLVYSSPNFFLHLMDMLENKDEYLKEMTASCFDDLINSVILAILSGETDMHSTNTILLKEFGQNKFTDICRVGIDERAYDDLVFKNASLQEIKDHFENQCEIYSNSCSSFNGRITITPRMQIEGIKSLLKNGLLDEKYKDVINQIANYNIDQCIADQKHEAGANLTNSHIDAIKYYLSQSEELAKI